MKAYVDKLPKQCSDCLFCGVFTEDSEDNYVFVSHYCDLTEEDVSAFSPCKNCPLKSLAEYKKQVVKEVCEEIREEFESKNANHIDELINEPTEQTILISKGFKACKERVFNKLDQIQENINKE